MATITVAGTITLPAGAATAYIYAVNMRAQYGFTSNQNCVSLGWTDGGGFSYTFSDADISEPFFLLFDFLGDAEPAVSGPYNYDGSLDGGGP